MKLKRAMVITRKIFWSLKHDKRSLMLIVLAPLLAMLLFGVAFSGNVVDVDVVVILKDEGAIGPMNQTIYLSKLIIGNVDDEVVKIHYMQDMTDAEDAVRDGDYYSVVFFPANFSSNIMRYWHSLEEGNTSGKEGSGIIIRSDHSNVNVATEINRAFMDAVQETVEEFGFSTPVGLDNSDPIYGEGAEFIDMFVPGIMGFAIFMLTTILTLITFVGERTRGTLSRLLASPVTEGDVVAGYALAFSIIGMFQVTILLTVAILVFDIIIVGNPFLALLIGSLLAVVSVSLGILLSSAARRESQAIQFFPIIVLPTFLLAGIFWPLEAIPTWLRPLSYFIPVTYAVEALRAVNLKGWGIMDIWIQLLALSGFAMLFLVLAVVSLKVSRRRA